MAAGKLELYENAPADEKGTGSRSRGWCFTINNYTDDDKSIVLALAHAKRPHPVYIIVGEEVGKKGTPHLQGYVYYESPRVFSVMKKALPRANIQAAKGTGEQNKTYCSKEGNVFLEEGEPPTQGERTDLEEIYAMLREGANMEAILDVEPNYQCLLVAEKWLKYKEPARDFKPVVHWLWGDPGTGKSKDAEAAFQGVFYSPPPTSVAKFWDCYDAHENVIIDDIDPGDIPYRQLLRMLDRYAYRVETKGGTRQLLAKTMYICTEEPPEAFVPRGKDAYALMRRLTTVTHYRRAQGVQPNYYPAQYVKEIDDATGSQEGDHQGPVQEEAQAGDSPGECFKDLKRENNLNLPVNHDDDLRPPDRTHHGGQTDAQLQPWHVCCRQGKTSLSGWQGGLPVRQGWLQMGDDQEAQQEGCSCCSQGSVYQHFARRANDPDLEEYPDWPQYDGLQEDDDADSC